MDEEIIVRVESPSGTRVWLVRFDKYSRPCAVEPTDVDVSDAITIHMSHAVPAASEVLAAVRRYFGFSYRLSA